MHAQAACSDIGPTKQRKPPADIARATADATAKAAAHARWAMASLQGTSVRFVGLEGLRLTDRGFGLRVRIEGSFREAQKLS